MKGDNIKYSAEDIRRYLDGQLTVQEMQALENAALEDPFLSDAIEGIEESRNHPVTFESALEDLQKTLKKRIRKKSKTVVVPLFSNWRIAASIVFILGTAVLTFIYINKNTHQPGIAKSIKKDSSMEKPTLLPAIDRTDTTGKLSSIRSTSTSESDKDVTAINRPADSKKRSGQKSLLSESKAGNADSLIKKREEYPTGFSSKTSSDTINGYPSSTSVVKNDEPAPKIMDYEKNKVVVKDEDPDRSENKSPSGNYIKGVVTDEKGNPIPYAAVTIKGERKSVITDKVGFFKLYTLDPEFANQIIINSAGYESFSQRLNPDSSYTNIIRLTPASTALNEVTVEGYTTAKKRDISSSIMKPDSQNVAQVSGWEAFRNYVIINKKIQGSDSALKGEEIISFVVNNRSELSSFKIEKSISPAHDAEVIRLIKEAPPLKILKGKKKRLQINIFFN